MIGPNVPAWTTLFLKKCIYYWHVKWIFFNMTHISNEIVHYLLIKFFEPMKKNAALLGVWLGVLIKPPILIPDSQKLTFSTLLNFLIGQHSPSTRKLCHALLAYSAKLSRQARHTLRVKWHGPILITLTFVFGILTRIVRNMFQQGQSDKHFSKAGTLIVWGLKLSTLLGILGITMKFKFWNLEYLTHLNTNK